MGFPRALEFLLLGLEVSHPALDFGTLGRQRRKSNGGNSFGFWRRR
jgi:hypothetical protein